MTDPTAPAERPYGVILYVGPTPPSLPGVRVADFTPLAPPAPGEVHPVVVRLTDSELTPADMRAKVLFMAGVEVSPADAVCAYATAVAFANRRVDVRVGERVLAAADIDAAARAAAATAARPAQVPDWVQVGAAHPDLTSVGVNGALTADEAALVRHARRVRLVPAADALTAIEQFLVIAGLRARGAADRFPILVRADAPAPSADPEAPMVGLDLDALRVSVGDVRRSRRGDDRSSVAPAVPLTGRQRALLVAAAVPVEATMLALGATTPDGEVWHCPRPSRHTNGDAVPSMKLAKGRARCFRCDAERVDSLRLVMDVCDLTGDDAAEWIAANVDPAATCGLAPAAPAES